MIEAFYEILTKYSLVVAFAVIGITVAVSYFLSAKLTRGRLHGSAIALFIGLVLAYIGGHVTGGEHGIADIKVFAGIGVMGGAMLRDLAIVATACLHIDSQSGQLQSTRRSRATGTSATRLSNSVAAATWTTTSYGIERPPWTNPYSAPDSTCTSITAPWRA